MAKDNPDALTAQYKVLIRPTDVGLLVMKRLQRPALDKSAELRRLIELGYAAEHAGFILDGTILRNGGRVWDVQPVLASAGGREQSKAAKAEATATPSSTLSTGGADSAVESVYSEATTRTEANSGAGTGLRANLRKLSNP